MKKILIRCIVLFLVSSSISIAADIHSISFTGGIPFTSAGVVKGEIFYKAHSKFYYGGGLVILSANPDGTGNTFADDVLIIRVTHPDGTMASFIHDYSTNCSKAITPLKPLDISSKFAIGLNQVSISIRDNCGYAVGSSSIWLNNLTNFSNTPKCFWMKNYSGNFSWVDTESIYGKFLTKQECFMLDSCNGGKGSSRGGCYKWAYSPGGQPIPW